MPDLFDIHSHVNFSDFNKDRGEVIERMKKNNIWTVCVGVDRKTSQECVSLAEKHKNIFASVGVHPDDNEKFDVEYYSRLAKNLKVMAIGECGLDLKNQKSQPKDGPPRAENLKYQKEVFIRQIELAIKLDKPLMIHCREAHEEVIKILNTYYLIHNTKLRGNIHFFSNNWDIAQKYFALGFTISFAGPITFSNQYDETIKKAPLDKIMIETDAPFAAPVPYRGKRSEPLYVGEIAKKIAEIKGISYEEVAKITTDNAFKFLNINS